MEEPQAAGPSSNFDVKIDAFVTLQEKFRKKERELAISKREKKQLAERIEELRHA